MYLRVHVSACVYMCSCARTCLLMCLCVRARASVLHLGRVKELSGQITSLALLGFLCLSVSAQMKICSTQIARVPSHRFLGNPSCLKPPVAVLFIVRECVRVRVCVCRCMYACVCVLFFVTIGDTSSLQKQQYVVLTRCFFSCSCS